MLGRFPHSPSVALFLSLLLSGCSSTPTAPPDPSLGITPEAAVVTIGDATGTTFTATLRNSDATVAWVLDGPGEISTGSGATTTYTPPASGGAAAATLTATAGSLSETAVIVLSATEPEPEPGVEGVWQASSGEEVFDFGNQYPLQYLDLSGNGASAGEGRLYGRSDGTGILACGDVIYGLLGEGVLAIYSSEVFDTLLFRYEMPDDDTLVLTNDAGESQTLARASDVPAGARCGRAVFDASFEGIELALAYQSNLLSDGTNLRVAGDDGMIYPVSTVNGNLGAGQDLNSSYSHAFAMQGDSYWGHCWCGGTDVVARVQPGGAVLDQIDTETDLGRELGVRSGAWDGSHLWLAGYSYDEQTHYLYKVDSEAEPDVLASATPFDGRIVAIAFHDGSMWALADALGVKLVRLDPVVGQALETYDLPEVDTVYSYAGLASLGGRLWLITNDDSSFGLYSVEELTTGSSVVTD